MADLLWEAIQEFHRSRPEAGARRKLPLGEVEAEVYVSMGAVRFALNTRRGLVFRDPETWGRVEGFLRRFECTLERREEPDERGGGDFVVNGPRGYVGRLTPHRLLLKPEVVPREMFDVLVELYRGRAAAPPQGL